MSYSKYLIYQKQVSYDGGQTWEDVEGETTYSGSPIETYASESGCVLDGGYKYLVVDTSGNTAYKGCDGNDVLTEHDIIDTDGMIGGWGNPTHLYIGNCVKTVDIAENASIGYFSGITFSRSVKNINAIVGYRNFKSAGYQIEQTLTIPNTVETISDGGAYWDNHGLQGADNIIFENNSSLKKIGNDAFANCSKLTGITIPDGVETIGEHAFAGCSGFTSVNIPNSVTNIGNGIFNSCKSLTDATIGNGVTTIPFEAFRGCSALTSVTIPDTVEIVGVYAFLECNALPQNQVWYVADNIIFRILPNATTATTVNYVPTIPNNIKILGDNALRMYNTNLDWSGFKIPSSITWIVPSDSSGSGLPYRQFYTDIVNDMCYIDTLCYGLSGTNYTTVSVREGTRFLARIGYNVSQVTLPNTLEVMMDYCLYGVSTTTVNIPDNVWYLGGQLGGVRGNSTITSVVFSNNSHLRTIGGYTFLNFTALQSITIPSGVTNIPTACFSGCTNFSSITLLSTTPPVLGDNAFKDTNLSHIYVPSGSVQAYKDADGWNSYANIIQSS